MEITSTDLACDVDEIRVIITGANETVTKTFIGFGHKLSNKISDDPGLLVMTGEGITLEVFFDELVAGGFSVPARGSISIDKFQLGNCDTDGNPGTFSLDEDTNGGTIVLTKLHEAPYCDESNTSWTLESCYRHR